MGLILKFTYFFKNKSFWEELITYFPLIGHGPYRKWRRQHFLFCHENVFTEPLPSNNRGIHRQTHRLSFDMTRSAQKTTCPSIIQLLCVFFAAETCSPSRCLATIGRIHIQTHRLMRRMYEARLWDGLRCHDMHTKFHKYWFRHSNFLGGYTHTQIMEITYFYFCTVTWRLEAGIVYS
jgi:hypothetical protein